MSGTADKPGGEMQRYARGKDEVDLLWGKTQDICPEQGLKRNIQETDMRKAKDVTAAIILNSENKVFIARRAPGENMAGGWEFPGGKLEQHETAEECLKRELFEEFGIEVAVKGFFCESIYEYPQGAIRLLAYFAEVTGGDMHLSVHDDYRWVDADELSGYGLLPADISVAEKLAGMMAERKSRGNDGSKIG